MLAVLISYDAWLWILVVGVLAVLFLCIWFFSDGVSSVIDHYACKDPNFPLTPPPDSNYLPQGWPYGTTGGQTGQGGDRGDTHV